ncbi:hypothetical protein GUI51_02865 [Enterococcus mundtii]|uniref:hypothetical protein n=1 Tax=Enterococcus mundtii TaxID=53346 RepID=UPI00101FBA86|nr:hypothetical protein [Enterococcus mundtii]MZZ57819.1 hypothetical protein [Enterococcus mundtii]MZZ60794.1 hypothetical protein [Enterococcus mundtii]MZZ67779.1 hypothetical protein [Enterococcus mundtii]MZZ96630.1 hypothetical protein [Enterococcus mundtii]MZZ99604.1 hypothetical protein [Enterococcus mundtii]
MNYYEYRDVVDKVSGLGSVSTLKRWRKLIEEQTETKFEVSTKRIGRNSTAKVYLFSEEDISKIQQVANLKDRLGLKKAILQIFSSKKQKTIFEVEREIDDLKEAVRLLIKISKQHDLEIKQLKQKNMELSQKLDTKKKRKFF